MRTPGTGSADTRRTERSVGKGLSWVKASGGEGSDGGPGSLSAPPPGKRAPPPGKRAPPSHPQAGEGETCATGWQRTFAPAKLPASPPARACGAADAVLGCAGWAYSRIRELTSSFPPRSDTAPISCPFPSGGRVTILPWTEPNLSSGPAIMAGTTESIRPQRGRVRRSKSCRRRSM